MWIIDKAREIIFYPVKAWDKIRGEKDNKRLLIYPLVLSLVQPVAIIFGYGVVGLWMGHVGYFRLSIINAFFSALVAYFLSLLGIAVMGFLIQVLANYFSAEGDIVAAMKLSIYSSTAPLLAGVFQIIPGIRILMILGLYGAYIMHAGIPKMMKTSHEKEPPFTFAVVISGIIMMLLINFLISQYIFGILYSDILTY